MGTLDLSAEQRPAASIERSVVVTAGAGSGKTRLLTARYLNLICAGVPPSRIAAMTFTRKAAAELRQRIDYAISLCARGASLDGRVPDEAERRRLFSARTHLEDGHLGTIHSFCYRVLAEEPALIRERPGATLLDETRAKRLLDEALRRVVNASDPLGSPLARLRHAGLKLTSLKEMAGNLLGRSWELDEARENYPPAPELLEKLALELEEEALELFFENLGKSPAETLTHLDGLLADEKIVAKLKAKELDGVDAHVFLGRLRSTMDRLARGGFSALDEDDLRLLHATKTPSGLGNTLKQYWNPFKAIKKAMEKVPGNTFTDSHDLEARAVGLTGELFDWVAEVEREYRRLKDRLRVVDNDDLLNRTAEGLRDNRELVAGLRRRYSHFLVDEFQDTDPRQWEIIEQLALPLEEGRSLFIVGDRKQAIYGFRGGDNTVFAQAARKLEAEGGEEVRLADNYRSLPAVLDFTNSLFGELFSADEELLAADPENSTAVGPQAMNCRRDDGPGSVIVVSPPPNKSKNNDIKNPEEAWLAAGVLRELLEGRLAGIPAPEDHPDEAVRAGRRPYVGVLCRTRDKLSLVAAALDHLGLGSRYALATGKGILKQAEAGWLRAALGAATDHRDGISLAALCLSPFGGLDYNDLLRLKKHADELGTGWIDLLLRPGGEEVAEGIAGEPRYASLRGRLTRWRRSAGLTSGSRLIAEIYRDTGIEAALCRRGETDRWKRLEMILELVRGEERVGGLGGPGDTLVWLRENEESRDFEEPICATEPVVLMTMHAAKGLEFPVVLLPFLNPMKVGSGEVYHALARDSEGRRRLSVKARSDEPPYKQIWSPLGEELSRGGQLTDNLEMKRLFYVVCTRAEEHLIILRSSEKEDANVQASSRQSATMLKWLNSICEFKEGEFLIDGHPLGLHLRLDLPAPIERPEDDESGRRADTRLLGPLRVSDPLPVNPSTLGELRRCQREFYLRRALKLGGPLRRRRDDERAWSEKSTEGWGSAFGDALHHLIGATTGRPLGKEALRNLLEDYARVEEEEPDYASAIGGPPGEKTLGALAEHLERLDGLEAWRAIRERRPDFEVPLRIEVEGCLVSGYIDCLTTGDGGLGVYDFKSTALAGRPLAEVTERHGYDLQLGVYALAAERLYGLPVTDLGLLYTAPGGGHHPLDIAESGRLAREYLALASRTARSHLKDIPLTSQEEDCERCMFKSLCGR